MSLETYDPNVRWAKHTIEITYQKWAYMLPVQVEMGGNCRGMALISDATNIHADQLYEQQGATPTLILTAPNGDELEDTCDEYVRDDDEEPDINRWLDAMCVCVRFVKHEEERRST